MYYKESGFLKMCLTASFGALMELFIFHNAGFFLSSSHFLLPGKPCVWNNDCFMGKGDPEVQRQTKKIVCCWEATALLTSVKRHAQLTQKGSFRWTRICIKHMEARLLTKWSLLSGLLSNVEGSVGSLDSCKWQTTSFSEHCCTWHAQYNFLDGAAANTLFF